MFAVPPARTDVMRVPTLENAAMRRRRGRSVFRMAGEFQR